MEDMSPNMNDKVDDRIAVQRLPAILLALGYRLTAATQATEFSVGLGKAFLSIAALVWGCQLVREICLEGRYPDSGRVRNELSKEIIFITEGETVLYLGNQKFELKKGDTALIMPKQEYYFEAKGLKMIIACSPAWSSNQHSIVPENKE